MSRLLAATVLFFSLLWGGAAYAAQTPAAPAASPPSSAQELERLARQLEDPADRQKLIDQVRALAAAQHAAEEKEKALTQPAADFLAFLAQGMESATDQVAAVGEAFSDAPKFGGWLSQQINDPVLRERTLRLLAALFAVVALGVFAERMTRWLLARPRRRLEAKGAEGTLPIRIAVLSARILLDVLALGLFVAVSYGVMTLFQVRGPTRMGALIVVNAYALARLASLAADTIFMPRKAAVRVLPVTDETAGYLYIWTRRVAGLAVYGYGVAQLSLQLGLPKAGYVFLMKLLGLLVTLLLAVFVLQNRQGVAHWLRNGEAQGALGDTMLVVRRRLADYWHLGAVLYLLVAFAVWVVDSTGGFVFVAKASALTAVILAAAMLAGVGLRRGVEKAFAISQEMKAQFPHLEARANRYVPMVHSVLRAFVIGVAGLALLEAWGADTFSWLATETGRRVASGLATIAVSVGLAIAALEAVNAAIERQISKAEAQGNRRKIGRLRTLAPLLQRILVVVLTVVVGLVILSEIGVNIAPLLAGAGVVGIAVGMGSQRLVQDLVTGISLMFQDSISVGDVVKLGEHTGVVEELSIRDIRLRDLMGNVHILPFNAVGPIVNMGRDFSFALFEIGVSYRENTDRVAAVIAEIGAELRDDPAFGPRILDAIEIQGVERFEASSVVIRARLRTQPLEQWGVAREFNRRLKLRFDAEGIEMPYPHMTLYFGVDKDGRAPPAQVRIESAS